MIRLDEAVVTVHDQRGGVVRILGPVTAELSEPRIAIIGANGSGKSTLARLINGLVAPSSGTVAVNGLSTVRDRSAVRAIVGFCFTDPGAQLLMPTPAEDVALSLQRFALTSQQRRERAVTILADLGLAGQADAAVTTLSGGQRQLAALAAVLACEPEILVCDEPTTLLDAFWRARVDELLAELPQQVVTVTHDMAAARLADRVIAVDRGQVISDGDPDTAIDHYLATVAERAGAAAPLRWQPTAASRRGSR